MYLKALEIYGFKSFPDRTRLNFKGGLTAVVGPNGSGKSNISDALRWVLGEQSTKTLRGARMEDVIFGGTQLRKAMGFAQVTLYIDNLDRSMPMDLDEVSITRKLYRSGESEYKINDQNVRLKDIVELFMDTGLGRDGYSMIGQGKIAEIVSAKSANRREIFEEAAGISKFRYRKNEAERKLVAAQENLLRLKDILVELEGRVEPLRVPAETAARCVQYAAERRTLELSIWTAQLEQTRGLLRVQEDKVAAAQANHAEVEEELAEVECAAEEAFAQISQCTVEIDGLRSAIRALEEQAAESQSQIAVYENDIFHNNGLMDRISQEISEQDSTGKGIEQQIAQKQEELTGLEAEMEQTREELDKLAGQHSELSDRERQAAQETENRRLTLAAVTMSLSEAKVAAVTSQSARNETQNRIELLRQSQAEKEQKRKDLTVELSDCRELIESIQENLQGLENTAGGLRIKRSGRETKRQELERELRAVEQKAGEKQQKARLLESLEQNMEGFAGSVKYIIGQQKRGAIQGVHSAVSKLIEVDAAYTTAVETALGGALQNIVVDNDEVAKRAIGMLKESRSGRATFLPISTIRGNRLNENGLQQQRGFVAIASDLVRCKREYRAIVENLLGRIVVAEDLNDAVAIARTFHNRFRVVTLDGQLVNVGGSMTGGSVAKSAGLLSRQPEIDRLRADAQAILQSGEAMRGKLKSLVEESSALEAQLLAVESEIKAANEDSIRYQSEQKRIELALRDLDQNQEDAQTQLTQLERRLAALEQEIGGAAERVESLQAEQQAAEAAIREQAARQEQVQAERATLATQRSGLEMELVAQTKDIEAARASIGEMDARREGQSQRISQYQAQIAELQAQNTQITEQIEALRRANGAFAEQAAQAQQQIAELQQKRQGCEQHSTEVRAREREIMARREQLARDLARVEEKKFSLQADYDAIIARMWDEYELTRSEAQAEAQPVEDMPKAQRELSEVKGRIKALGSVNLEAIDEYEQVSQRYKFLKAQIEDVENSREQLGQIIHDLTAQMREMFTSSFQQINRHFGQIFTELFGGGKGELSLTDEGDVLESGIEIHVQPPGKLIKNLASLSGGEQAFVAIAIYFAILKVRPAPFCLLDEIEAALDDVNVTKYAQYLRRLSNRTQFVIITHRRGTMEEADMLYGVTMQEEGVSKLLELSVSELESKLGMTGGKQDGGQ